MPRKRPPREPCECIACRQQLPASPVTGTAVAQQQPPPRCLILYAPHCYEAPVLEPPCLQINKQLPHVDAVGKQGCTGLLALRKGEGSYAEMLDLRNIFGTIPICRQPEGKGAEERGASLRHLECELVTNSPQVAALGKSAGFTHISRSEAYHLQEPDKSQASAQRLASRLGTASLKQQCLGERPQEAGEEESCVDLIFACLDSPQTDGNTGPLDGQMLDDLLKELSNQPGFHETVLLVILLGIRCSSLGTLLQPGGKSLKGFGVKGYDAVKRPKQSYEVAALDEAIVDQQHALLSIQCLPYVIRKDEIDRLPDILADGFKPGHGCILAERLLPELAYKLNAAPKYGA